MELDERKRRVLSIIADLYTKTGEPVGSKVVALYLDSAYSPATIRNDMAALFDLGLLEQPHTLSDPEIVRVLSALPGVTANPAGGQVFQEFMVDFRATGKSVAEIHQALLARNIFGGVDLGKVFPAYAGYALYCVSDTTTAADIDTLCAALHDILGGTGA